ncbi:hypothetical protein [Methanoculleus sp.]|uniref:hypothetical protein n=1 Tax=Methanoculleus sp. TaxID=90427 RepID=UPI0025F6BD6C|nr:hypothetical protein [Methanoculleus sp.]
MVALRLLALDDVSFRSWEGNSSSACNDVWVVFSEKGLFPEFLKHFSRASGRDMITIPYSKDFF